MSYESVYDNGLVKMHFKNLYRGLIGSKVESDRLLCTEFARLTLFVGSLTTRSLPKALWTTGGQLVSTCGPCRAKKKGTVSDSVTFKIVGARLNRLHGIWSPQSHIPHSRTSSRVLRTSGSCRVADFVDIRTKSAKT